MNKGELKDEFELDIEFEVDKNNRVDMNQVIELISAYNKLFRTYKQLKTQIDELNKQLENTINSYTEEHNMRHNSDLELDILKTQQKEFISYLEDKIYSIEPKGTGINYNCEYDSEEDYVMAMQEQSRLNTLKENLQKYKSIIGVLDETNIK